MLFLKFTPRILCTTPLPAPGPGAALQQPQAQSQNRTSVSDAVATEVDSGAIVQTLAAARHSFTCAITLLTIVYGSHS